MTAPADLYTPDRIIRQALKDAGRLQTGATPTGEVFADCLSRLNDIINFTQTQGIKLWLNSIHILTPVAGTATYALGPASSPAMVRPPRVLEAWYVASTSDRRPLIPLSRNEYGGLGNLTQQGSINSYYVDKQRTNLYISLWQVPDTQAATGRVHLLLQQQATAPTELDETIAFPIEWFMYLRWALADDLSTGQPIPIMERATGKAEYYRQALENWDVEDAAIRFQPDPQAMGLAASRFR